MIAYTNYTKSNFQKISWTLITCIKLYKFGKVIYHLNCTQVKDVLNDFALNVIILSRVMLHFPTQSEISFVFDKYHKQTSTQNFMGTR